MPAEKEILERIVETARAKKQGWAIPIHSLHAYEFDVLCRAGAEVVDQWKDSANGIYCIIIEYQGFRFFYGNSTRIEIMAPDDTPT